MQKPSKKIIFIKRPESGLIGSLYLVTRPIQL